MLTMVTLPNMTTVISESSTISSPWFTEFLWVIYLAVGVTVAILSLVFIKNVIVNAASKFFHDSSHVSPPPVDGGTSWQQTRELYNYHKTGQWGNFN